MTDGFDLQMILIYKIKKKCYKIYTAWLHVRKQVKNVINIRVETFSFREKGHPEMD